jgi:hypothetical protein
MHSANHSFDLGEAGDENFRPESPQAEFPQEPKSPEETADRFGIRTALLVLCVGLLIAAMWLVTGPSFEKWQRLIDTSAGAGQGPRL